MDNYYVYALCDQRRIPFYFGSTKNPKRLEEHKNLARAGDLAGRSDKIRTNCTSSPDCHRARIVEGLLESDAREIEQWMIWCYDGHLTNRLVYPQYKYPERDAQWQARAWERLMRHNEEMLLFLDQNRHNPTVCDARVRLVTAKARRRLLIRDRERLALCGATQ